MSNIKRDKNYSQVCVWPGTILPEDQIEKFVNYFADNGYRIQYLETVITEPDRNELGIIENETGGRHDVFFAIHNDDISKFAIPRLQMGIRWIEDVLDNEARETEYSIYPERVKEYRTW
tara:strand:- start:660 stop:1016 length:357 start_codon:yes stop_codon:yes gene_type:complete